MNNQWLINLLIKNLFEGDRDYIYQIIDNHELGQKVDKLEKEIYSSLETIQELKIHTAFRAGFDLANILFGTEPYFNSFSPNNPKIKEFSEIIKDDTSSKGDIE